MYQIITILLLIATIASCEKNALSNSLSSAIVNQKLSNQYEDEVDSESLSVKNQIDTERKSDSTVLNNIDESFVFCECEVIDFESEYLYCDNDVVDEGEASSIGSYPWFKIQIVSPQSFKGREFEVIYQFGKYLNEPGESENLSGNKCSVELPEDFLEGKYKTIVGDFVRNLTIRKLP